jgi:hypothetical protein
MAVGAGCSGKYTDGRDGSSMSDDSCGRAKLCDAASAGKPGGGGVGGTGSTTGPYLGGSTSHAQGSLQLHGPFDSFGASVEA